MVDPALQNVAMEIAAVKKSGVTPRKSRRQSGAPIERAWLVRHDQLSALAPIVTEMIRCAKCMARPCVARRKTKTDERESCNNVSGL